MEPIAIILMAFVALVAVMVGVAIPTVVQMRRTAASAQQFFEGTNRKLGPVLDDIRESAARLNRVSAALEEGTRGVQDTFRAIQDITRSLARLRDSLRTAASVGMALGPAVAAGVRALLPTEPADGGGGRRSGARRERGAEASGVAGGGESADSPGTGKPNPERSEP